MRYLTDRKRAVGMGSAKSGTAHFWAMKVSAVALLILIPLFVFTFGPMLGKPHAFAVTMKHFKDGVQVLIEDYVHGVAEKISIVVMICVCYAIAATGLFAIARIAL